MEASLFARQSTVLCLDELGPAAARAYPGPSWSEANHRPHFRPDYSRHGYVWAFGALAHRDGRVLVDTAARRTTASWLHFLDRLEGFGPAWRGVPDRGWGWRCTGASTPCSGTGASRASTS